MHTAPSEIKGDDVSAAHCGENHKRISRSEVYRTTSDLNSNTKFGTKKTFFEATGYGSEETGPDGTRKTSLIKDSWTASPRTDLLGRPRHHQANYNESNKSPYESHENPMNCYELP